MHGKRVCLVAFVLFAAEASALEPHVIFERTAPSVWVVREGDAALGSAVVIAPGRLITNCHVVLRSRAIQVAKDNTSFNATIEYSDAQRDLCQLSVRNFFAPAVALAPMQNLKVGQRVYSIASPSGRELAIGEGMVSSLRTATDGSPLIQTTVAVTRGSSGGGLFDTEARLVGITSYVASEGPTTNFAQPADWIQEVPERGKEALARRADPSPASASGSATASGYPRQLTREDLVAHFSSAGKVQVMSPPHLWSLNFAPGNRISLTYFSSRDANGLPTSGSYQVRPDGQVCFNLPPWYSAYDVGWNWMSDCFRVSQIDEKTFSLKSLRGDTSFSYALR